MTIAYLEALAAIALSLSILMAFAWVVQQRSGNSGWVDTIWTFSVGLVGAGSALWPVAGAAPNARQWLVAALVAVWSLRLGVHIAIRTAAITDDPRYAAFAREWGADSPSDRSRWCLRSLLPRGSPPTHDGCRITSAC
jgi:steroid 5-alpha reductase family enzyme